MLKRHPYIFTIITATLLAIVVWLCVPKEYAAYTKVSDEYKETDLAVGLNKFSASIKSTLGLDNVGVNDFEVYCKVLNTNDFARQIANTKVQGKACTYGEWVTRGRHFWESNDTTELVAKNISCNISSKSQTLTIQFTDRDPLVASLMLDAVTEELQNYITSSRHAIAQAALLNSKKEMQRASLKYHNAQRAYVSYADSHFDTKLEQEIQQQNTLKNDVDQAFNYYEESVKSYTRQKYIAQRAYCSFAVITPNTVPTENTSHLFVYVCAFVLMALAVVKSFYLLRQRQQNHDTIEFGGIFSPWLLTLIVWGFMGLLFWTSGDNLDPLTPQFYIAIALWLLIFPATSFVTFNLLKHDTKPLPMDGIEINRFFFYFLFVLAIVLSPMYLYKVWQIVSVFESKDIMNNIRLLATQGSGQGFLNYAIVISQSLLLVSLWRYPKLPLWQIIAIIVCCILSSLAIMEKGGLFLTVLCSLYVLFERRVIRIRTIVIIGCLSLLGFYFFNLMREGEDSEYAKNESLMDFIGMYIMSPPVAFCRIKQDITDQIGVNTFEVVYDYLHRFGIGNYAIHNKVQEFVYVPVSTNVYTVMQPFYRDFGFSGVAFFAWMYGLITGVVYRLSQNGSIFFICLYTYFVELIVLQFYQDNLFLSMSFNIQLMILVACCTQNIVKFHLFSRKHA